MTIIWLMNVNELMVIVWLYILLDGYPLVMSK